MQLFQESWVGVRCIFRSVNCDVSLSRKAGDSKGHCQSMIAMTVDDAALQRSWSLDRESVWVFFYPRPESAQFRDDCANAIEKQLLASS